MGLVYANGSVQAFIYLQIALFYPWNTIWRSSSVTLGCDFVLFCFGFFFYFRLYKNNVFYFRLLHLICLECTDVVIGWYIGRHSVWERITVSRLYSLCIFCTVHRHNRWVKNPFAKRNHPSVTATLWHQRDHLWHYWWHYCKLSNSHSINCPMKTLLSRKKR